MTTQPLDDRGSALLGVMLFSGLAALVVAVLLGRVVTEYRAVEDSLAQARAYWAAMGFNNYVLSRTLVGGACTGKAGCTAMTADDSPQANSYLQEIADMQDWYYVDVSTSYFIQLKSQVCQDKNAPVGALGEIVIKTSFSGNGGPGPPMPQCPAALFPLLPVPVCPAETPTDPKTIGSLASLGAARPVEFHYCVVATGATSCGSGPTAGTPGGAQLITSVHRPAC